MITSYGSCYCSTLKHFLLLVNCMADEKENNMTGFTTTRRYSGRMQEDGRTLRLGERLWWEKMQLVPGETSESYTRSTGTTHFFSIRSPTCIWYTSSNYRSISNCLLFCFMILLVYVRLKEGFFCCISWYFSSCYLGFFFNYTHYFQFIAFVSVSFCQRDRSISHLPFYTVRLLGTF